MKADNNLLKKYRITNMVINGQRNLEMYVYYKMEKEKKRKHDRIKKEYLEAHASAVNISDFEYCELPVRIRSDR